MWQFYGPAIQAMPKNLLQFGHVIHTIVFYGALVLTIAGCEWKEVGPLWGAAILSSLAVISFLQAVYEHHRNIVKSLSPPRLGEDGEFFVGTWHIERKKDAIRFVMRRDGTVDRMTPAGYRQAKGKWECKSGEAHIRWNGGRGAILRCSPSGRVWRLLYSEGQLPIPNEASLAVRLEVGD